MSTADYLVMGFATNLDPVRLEVFAKTLRSVYSPQQCDLVIITNRVDDKLNQLAQQYAIEFVHTPNSFSFKINKFAKLLYQALVYLSKWLAETTQRIPSLRAIFYELYPLLLRLWHHPLFVRWMSYQDFLKVRQNYKRILISDVRDVSFQAPFFEHLGEASLHLFEQDQIYGVAEVDTRWYQELYGSQELAKVNGKPALCLGTIMGDFQGVKTLVDSLCEDTLKCPFGRVDQTVFNKLFYEGRFNGVTIQVHDNKEGPILTISEPHVVDHFKTDLDGVFYKENKNLIPVIHMYDRHSETLAYFTNVVGYEINGKGFVKS
ncbi:hypothetical protein H6F67_04415 [Microcoleus sp. FACHB-1515]|uniref:hypothetical protein n=1 Tax=Cyanophyceae TaxID=3028117 RepID=UPI001687722D|nr:hypothetical protein [Microcoleus sp. FACHB-1515]MBD2089097.1 hypothetical protein [Microcoleus sp. FACHB-1515]